MSNQLFSKGVAVAALALGACGGGGTTVGCGVSDGEGDARAPASNFFFSAVNAVIAGSFETLEPRKIDSIKVTFLEHS